LLLEFDLTDFLNQRDRDYCIDEISNTALAPVPDSLVDHLPKLRGAKFSVDEDGAIIIVGEGRYRADAVIDYH
jgi:hypothetical protein